VECLLVVNGQGGSLSGIGYSIHMEAFDNFSKEFLAKRAVIADWLEDHKED
jgi:hypothetical protein